MTCLWAHADPNISQVRRMRSEARPFRQSDIDGLCGLHALFNAVHYLFPKKFPLWGESAYELAHAIADDMSDAEFKAAWKHGQERSDMERMLVAASDHLRKEGHAARLNGSVRHGTAQAHRRLLEPTQGG